MAKILIEKEEIDQAKSPGFSFTPQSAFEIITKECLTG